jgi:histidyl-tRNA synthetase
MGEIQAIRGTKDILPAEVGYWQWLEETASRILGTALYQEIRTPIFEQTQLFERGIGEATDVVGKEMYSFLDRGQRSLTLRLQERLGLFVPTLNTNYRPPEEYKDSGISGPMFRYERPQAGRQLTVSSNRGRIVRK